MLLSLQFHRNEQMSSDGLCAPAPNAVIHVMKSKVADIPKMELMETKL